MRMLTKCKILMATLLIAVVMVSTGAPAQERNPAGRESPDVRLPAPARGPAALSALLSHLPELAASYGKSTEELRSVFLRDNTIWADIRGRLFYACEFGPTPPVVHNASQILQAPYPTDQTFFLHSRPGATKVIYLDFDGHLTSGTFWNIGFNSGQDIVSAPYDLD